VFILGVSEATYARLAANVFPVALNAAAVFAGFQAASQSVMLAVLDSPTMKALRKSGHYQLLVDYQWGLIRTLFWFIFAGLAVLTLGSAGMSGPSFRRTGAAALASLFTWLFLACLRAARLMVKLLRAGHGPGE
jgi:hypothetical protein